MKQVVVRGFIIASNQQPVITNAESNEYRSVVVQVQLPDDTGDLDCAWLIEACSNEFKKVGVEMRVVGLLAASSTAASSSVGSKNDVPSGWMLDPSTKLDTMNLSGELEAVFMRDTLSIGSSGKASKIGASDFEFIRLLGEGATCKVFQVRRKKTGKMYAVKVLEKDRILGNHRKVEQALTERQVLVEVRHPFIVQLHWTFQTRAHLYFVLEMCSGGGILTSSFMS
jgi:hypothetical protein